MKRSTLKKQRNKQVRSRRIHNIQSLGQHDRWTMQAYAPNWAKRVRDGDIIFSITQKLTRIFEPRLVRMFNKKCVLFRQQGRI